MKRTLAQCSRAGGRESVHPPHAGREAHPPAVSTALVALFSGSRRAMVSLYDRKMTLAFSSCSSASEKPGRQAGCADRLGGMQNHTPQA